MFIFHSAKLDDAPPKKKKKKKKKKKRSYTIREKRDAVRLMQEQDDKLLRFTGHATSKTMKGQGRKEMFPDVSAIVTFLKDKCCDEVALTTRSIMEYMWQLEPNWVTNYMAEKRSGLQALQC
ncbi:hypothetical protein JG687_00011093, partial [Phytophthora cactorum]